jgi:hypothetical protein
LVDKKEHLSTLDKRFMLMRLIVFLSGALATMVVFQFAGTWLGLMTVLISLVVFGYVVLLHRKLDKANFRFEWALRYTKAQLGRVELDWDAIPPVHLYGDNTKQHSFDLDLNISGERSIHALIDTATSIGGSEKLIDILLSWEEPVENIFARQALIKELTSLKGFRNGLIFAGVELQDEDAEMWDGEVLLNWLENQNSIRGDLKGFLIFLGWVAILNFVLVIMNIFFGIPAYWMITVVALLLLQQSRYGKLKRLMEDAYFLSQRLKRFGAVLLHLEKYPYHPQGPLSKFCEPFWIPSEKPSALIRKVTNIATAASFQKNQFLWVIVNAFFPWDLYFYYRLEQCKKEVRGKLENWLEYWYTLEALSSLANFAYLNPKYVFPEISSKIFDEGTVFTAKELGHPLLPEKIRVCNDFLINSLGEIAIITGSNMSGKSTFLRTIGVNLCLAFAGSVVSAEYFKTIPYRLFACINVSDSVTDGISYFYAEVKRLSELLEVLNIDDDKPLFYLIDEIFRGTNNREREIGSWSFVRSLLHKPGVGVISTHDLNLTRLSAEFEEVRNFHFREEIKTAQMVFEYKIKPGPCPTTNALKIMALEGLPVDHDYDIN